MRAKSLGCSNLNEVTQDPESGASLNESVWILELRHPMFRYAGSDWSGTETGNGDSFGAASAKDSTDYETTDHQERQAMLAESPEGPVRSIPLFYKSLLHSFHHQSGRE